MITPKVIVVGLYAYGYGAILSHNHRHDRVGEFAHATHRSLIRIRSTEYPQSLATGLAPFRVFGPYDNFSYQHNFSGDLTWIGKSQLYSEALRLLPQE